MNILVIAPHPDDEAIGCGGSICLHVERGDRVVAVFLTSGELGLKHLSPAQAWGIREGEARCAARVLGLAGLHFLRQTLGESATLLRFARLSRGAVGQPPPRIFAFPLPHLLA